VIVDWKWRMPHFGCKIGLSNVDTLIIYISHLLHKDILNS
jgi:hypothetical protein